MIFSIYFEQREMFFGLGWRFTSCDPHDAESQELVLRISASKQSKINNIASHKRNLLVTLAYFSPVLRFI